uniref:Transmembrane protein 223 n=1 Tax=Suricata suricatta TaxID=37032 RepID=A0A673TDV9_SURSU
MAAPRRLLLALRPLPARRSLHDAAPPRDVLLFEHERGRFFAVLGLFCAGQGVFWASLAVAALARPPARTPDAESPPRGSSDLRSTLWRCGLALGCGAIAR